MDPMGNEFLPISIVYDFGSTATFDRSTLDSPRVAEVAIMNVGKIKPFRAAFVREPDIFLGQNQSGESNNTCFLVSFVKRKKHELSIFLGHLVSKIDFFWKWVWDILGFHVCFFYQESIRSLANANLWQISLDRIFWEPFTLRISRVLSKLKYIPSRSLI